jgi:carbohydrate-binding DOMON domain-containing protein
VVPGPAFKGDEDDSSLFDVVSSQYVNEPSAFQTTGDYFQPRIYFAELANFFANLFRTTLIEFVTRTKTRTVTRTSTETTTNSFFLSGCTPSPFPFLICK